MFLMYERVSYAALRPGKGWSDSSSTGVREGCRNVPSSCMPYAPGSAFTGAAVGAHGAHVRIGGGGGRGVRAGRAGDEQAGW